MCLINWNTVFQSNLESRRKKMEKDKVRVRFAPSPTGLMHLGNIRTALMNYLFSKQKNGSFILRIEDTDPERNFDPSAKQILSDLAWLHLNYNEGPQKDGPFAPYFQSKRMHIYQAKLEELIKDKQAYRCFCTHEALEKKRQRQIALKMPPRYDKTCLRLTDEEIQKNLNEKKPFIWRMKLDDSYITIQDLAHGTIKFDLKHFSDFPLTRQNGTFTFMFSNFVDDMLMKITHILRGEDHLTNTAGQAALYRAFNAPLPIFWHMPILCNIEGKKLSKRDFGFSLNDLKNAGFLPEAICNYLAIIGGSFKKEIMSLEELASIINLDSPHAKGQIKYDVEKLKWINHKWIEQYDPEKLTQACLPFLKQAYPQVDQIDKTELTKIIQILKTDLITLNDIKKSLQFYFEAPVIEKSDIVALSEQKIKDISLILEQNVKNIDNRNQFIANLKEESKAKGISPKEIFSIVRIALIGSSKGPSIRDLLEILSPEQTKERIGKMVEIIKQ